MEKQPTTNDISFWNKFQKIGTEVLGYGNELGFGNVIMEVKFANDTPAVIIRSITKSTKYPTNSDAKIAIAKKLEQGEKDHFDGAQTFTVVWKKGHIDRILVDEYENMVI